MKDKVMLGEFIYCLRKEKGLSQIQLGEMVGVSNKAVSKWETNEANPEIGTIPLLAEILGVTCDELLNCERVKNIMDSAKVEDKASDNKPKDNKATVLGFSGVKTKTNSKYEFVSDLRNKKGKPVLHINVGKESNGTYCKAEGTIAIGVKARGLVSFGLLSFGLVSFGLVAFGLLSFGLLAFGLMAFGMVSFGAILSIGGVAVGLGVSVGGVAFGTLAIGGVAFGYMSIGGIAFGYYAHTGISGLAYGVNIYFHY